jgi:hypothetical protein
MATQAQILANQANARLSTGPKTAAGKARSSQNATTHGLTAGILHIPAHETAAFRQFEAKVKQAIRPQGSLERTAAGNFVYAAWRLRKIRALLAELYREHRVDPLVAPDAAAAVRQLTRYRATVEMMFFRSLKQLRELQTNRAARNFQLHAPERVALPKQLDAGLYRRIPSHPDRESLLSMRRYLGPWAMFKPALDENWQLRVFEIATPRPNLAALHYAVDPAAAPKIAP